MKTVRDIDLTDKVVLLRADYNVPLEEGSITDDYRIQQSIPTVEYLLERAASVVIISHLGRPESQDDSQYSLQPVAERLQGLIGQEVQLATDLNAVDSSKHRVTLLENLRYWPGEEANDAEFAQKLAQLGEIFVQDGFGVVHRAHASTSAITQYLPSVAGLLLEKEVHHITQAMHDPKRPLVAIMGGAKISDKIQVLERLVERADQILIGGAMANTFLDYAGYEIGKSNYESGQEAVITRLAQKALQRQPEDTACNKPSDPDKVCLECVEMLELPRDVAVAQAIDPQALRREVSTDHVGSDEYILDIGTATAAHFQEVVASAATVVWNGPLGLTELTEFTYGSDCVAQTLKDNQQTLTSIIGGGDTAGFIIHWNGGEGFTHISTGGGAALDLMAGEQLPGVEALNT